MKMASYRAGSVAVQLVTAALTFLALSLQFEGATAANALSKFDIYPNMDHNGNDIFNGRGDYRCFRAGVFGQTPESCAELTLSLRKDYGTNGFVIAKNEDIAGCCWPKTSADSISYLASYYNPDNQRDTYYLKSPGPIGDPHFTTPGGIEYDFDGKPGAAFCIITDSRLQVNMKLVGGFGVGSAVHAPKMLTWIGELGFVWKTAAGKQHTLLLAARNGTDIKRGTGFLAERNGIVLDGSSIARPQVGETISFDEAGVSLKLSSTRSGWGSEKHDLETYALSINGLISLEFNLLPPLAHQQGPNNAFIHFDVSKMSDFDPSGMVHGILGQTYRADLSARHIDWNVRKQSNKSSVTLFDSPSKGHGLLLGAPKDYAVPYVTSPICAVSVFGKTAVTGNGEKVSQIIKMVPEQ